MEEQKAVELLSTLGQSQILERSNALSVGKREKLLSQLDTLDIPTFHLQQYLLKASRPLTRSISPFDNFALAGNSHDLQRGKEMIARGLVGCLIVAGGQGTRLRFEGPKGMCPVTKIHHKTLFQVFAEKVVAAGKQAQRLLPLAIMTSPQNHEATLAYFEKNQLFGLERTQLTFFCQEVLPLLDSRGNLFLETPDTLATGPDGNGGAIHQFFNQGIWADWHKQGVRYLNFVLIDNPLADPFDAELVGFHQKSSSDIVVKATFRRDGAENVGILVKDQGRAAVVEYSELDHDARMETNAEGTLRYPIANISLFSFSMEFIKDAVHTKKTMMPLHKAFKAVKYLNADGNTVQAEKPMAWKFEKFIFDLLPAASKVDALIYPREKCFAPLKNFSGLDSLETVPDALEENDRQTLATITGVPSTASPLEISQDFYYPTPELITMWRNRHVKHSGYINAFSL